MPDWFLLTGVFIATSAAIIASQALISGSFTIISEAIRLNLYPKVTVRYPSDIKGQMYIPGINTLLFLGCCSISLYFRDSTRMEHAYGLSITIAMLATTVLLIFYLLKKRVHPVLVGLIIVVYLFIEFSFLGANLLKFWHGGYVTVIIAGLLILLMWIWLRAHQLKGMLTNFVNIQDYVPQFVKLSDDNRVPYYSTHLVYLSAARDENSIERNILYSCLQGFPKRAMTYWFVHVEVTDEPYTLEYKVKRFAENDLYKITFRLGFRIEQRISYYLRIVIEDMKEKNEVELLQTYHMIEDQDLLGDFRFVMVDDVLAFENDLPIIDKFVLDTYLTIKHMIGSPEKWFGLDPSLTMVEKVPLLIKPIEEVKLKRVEK
jgi:KUP system potassium uptake protein